MLDKVNAISKAQKSYVTSGGKDIDALNRKIGSIDAFKTQFEAFKAARLQFRNAEADVQRLGRAMKSASEPSAALSRDYERAQRSVSRAAEAFREQTAAIKAAKAEMASYGVTLKTMGKQVSPPPHRQGMPPAAHGQIPPVAPPGGGMPSVIAGPAKYLGPAAIAYGAYRAHGAVVDKHHDFQQAYLYQQAVLGMDEKKQAPLLDQAAKIGQDTKFSNADIVKAQTDIGAKLPKNLQSPAAIAAITEHTKNYALAMQVSMEEASVAMVGWMASRGYDLSSPQAAEKSARRASNQMVEYAKSTGKKHHDIVADTKFGAAPGRVAGISEAFSMALSAQLGRVGYEGAMTGTFGRAIASKLSAPTQKGQAALASMGLNFSDYINPGADPSVGGLDKMLKQRFGRSLDDKQKSKLESIFNDPEIRGDQGSFVEAVSSVLNDSFAKKGKNGKTNAQDAERIAKTVNDFSVLSASGINIEKLIIDILSKGITPALGKFLLGQEHGGRLQTIDYKQFLEDLKTFRSTPENRAESVANKMQQGAQGEYTKMVGSVETFTVAIGEATDGLRSFTYKGIGALFDSLTNLVKGKADFGHKAAVPLTLESEMSSLSRRLNDPGLTEIQRKGLKDQLGKVQGRHMLATDAVPVAPAPNLGAIEAVGTKADEAKEKLDGLNTTVTPNVNSEPVQKLGAALDEVLGKLERINGAVGSARKSVASLGSSVPSASSPGRGRSDIARATASLSRSRETNQTDRDFS
ncbi:MAG: phage tail tape measure protein [Proteobacteria bacterium]|nr:phage tail tape measure protein [Pseudomonadota bacterium]